MNQDQIQKIKPYTRKELANATIAESYEFLNLVDPKISSGVLSNALVKYAAAVEKMIMGDEARGFE